MTTPSATSPARAIAMMVSAVFCLSIMDVCVKAVSPSVGPLPALWARYAGQMLVVLVLVAPRLKQVVRARRPGLQLARALLLMAATFFFFFSLSYIGLAEATAVMVLNPIFITLGGALFLGEPLGPRRIGAIVVSFLGALLIIRPGSEAFNPAALMPMGAALCFAGYSLVTRAVGSTEDVWTSLFYTASVGGILMTLAAPAYWVWPDPGSAALMCGIACAGTMGQLLLIRAFSQAEAGLLAPFGYSGLIFAIIFGLIFFAEVPTVLTLCGAAIIALAGLYVWWRETRLKKVAARSAAP
ncbi:DMT family transporter [Aliishimia ponticola]|uniref:DMT family transporter n=1 Tax=Aliishimia ponticola TaxID=2499833 RepID=A0A4S4NFF7_9RHOB|nr:DMT family transporter [Aliishimia ponticola]THH38269.1 DMT family transporter [Aliishimia ponticola]